MSEIRNLTRNGETFYPLTTSSAVINESTGEGLVIDDAPTPGSDNLAKSGGVYKANCKFAPYICSDMNIFRQERVRANKSPWVSGNHQIIDVPGIYITDYILIPKDCTVIEIDGRIVSDYATVRFSKLPVDDDNNTTILYGSATSSLTINVTEQIKQCPYMAAVVYRGSAESVPDFSNVSIKFKNDSIPSKLVQEQLYGEYIKETELLNNGFVRYTTGIFENGTYRTSDFIHVTEGQYIEVTDIVSGSVAVISAYSSNTESSYVQSASIPGSDGAVSKVKYIVPVGVNYIRFSCSSGGLESFIALIATENVAGNLTIVDTKLEEDEKSLSKVSDTIQVGWFYGFIKPTGEIAPGMSYRYTDYIPVSGGQIFDVPSTGNSSITTTATFYSSKNQSSIITDLNIYPPSDWSAVRKKISIPFGVSYMRVCCGYDTSLGLFVQKLGSISVELPKVSTLAYTTFKKENVIELFNVGNLRQGKSIFSHSPYNIIDYTANRVILTDYIDVAGISWIEYSGIPSNGEFMSVRFSKTKDDNASADDVEVISLNYSSALNSGTLFIGHISKEYRYMTFTVCRVNSDVSVSLDSVSIKGVISDSYSQQIFKYKGIAPKRPCLTFQMDINGASLNSQTTYNFIELCKNAGFAPTFFPMSSDASNLNLKKWIDSGCEIGIHTIPSDNIGLTNPEPHPNETQFKNIVNGYIESFVSNGINPIGWVTSQGKMVPALVPLLDNYVGYAHTEANANWVVENPVNWVNTKNTDKLAILRWGVEMLHNGSDGATVENDIAKAKQLIDCAIEVNGLIVFYTHSYNLYEGTTYTLREEVFLPLLDYIKQKVNSGRLIVGTTAEVCNYYYGK